MVASSVFDIKMSRASCQPNAYDVKHTASDVRRAACDVRRPGGTISQPLLDFNARKAGDVHLFFNHFFLFVNRLNINKKFSPTNITSLLFYLYFPLKIFISLFELVFMITIQLAEIFAALKSFPIIAAMMFCCF